MKNLCTIKSTLSLALTMALLTAPLLAETIPSAPLKTSVKTHNIGVGAGFLSGYGMTYRHWSPSDFGYQVAFVPVIRMNDDETFINTSTGLIGLRSFHKSEMTNLFGYFGGHYNYTYEHQRRQAWVGPSNSNLDYNFDETTNHIFTGGGLGIEFHFANINFSIMTGYAAHLRTWRTIDTHLDYNGVPAYQDSGKWRHEFELQPSIESALFYSF